MMNLRRLYILLFFISGPLAAQELDEQHTFYLSKTGWHTAVVIPASAIPDSLWTNEQNFSNDLFLAVGWGDADYFPSDGFNLWYAFKSVFWPTSSVLHINPFNQPVEKYYSETDVVKLEVDAEQFQGLIEFLIESFKLDTVGKIIPAAEGLYPNSHFFKGREKYYFPKNSNVWGARVLKKAGFSLTPIRYQTAGSLLKRAGRFGE